MVISLGCSTISVSYDYDTKTNFTSLKTFDFMSVPVQSNINAFNVKRIQDAVRNQLESKGYTQVPDNPDFQIAMHISKQEKIQVTDWGYTFGRRINWGDNLGPGGINVYEYEEGTLILDFVDAQSKELIWRGVGTGDVQRYANPKKRDVRISEDVQKLLRNFPPTKKY
jgi:hypothetical protein